MTSVAVGHNGRDGEGAGGRPPLLTSELQWRTPRYRLLMRNER